MDSPSGSPTISCEGEGRGELRCNAQHALATMTLQQYLTPLAS